jgi:hypothetical protein
VTDHTTKSDLDNYWVQRVREACRDLDGDFFDDDYDFFSVMMPEGWPNDFCKYDNLDAAIDRAEQLASRHPGEEFFIVKSVAVSTKQAITTTIYI